MAGDVTVAGETIKRDYWQQMRDMKRKVPEVKPEKIASVFAALRFSMLFVSFASALVVGLVMLRLFPNYAAHTAQMLSKRPWASLGVGFAALILTPVAAIFLAVTVLGLPLAGIVFLGYLLFLYFAKIHVAYWIAHLVNGRKAVVGLKYVLALLGMYVVFCIPIVGGFMQLFVTVFGLGQLLLTKQALYQSVRKAKIA
jgi:hypothetical protein